jgi:hypothetical protein
MLPEIARQVANAQMDAAIYSLTSLLTVFDVQKLIPSIYEHLFLFEEAITYLLFASGSKEKPAILPSSQIRRWINPLSEVARANLRGLVGVYSRIGMSLLPLPSPLHSYIWCFSAYSQQVSESTCIAS